MAQSSRQTKVDPNLTRQLKAAEEFDHAVQAVFVLGSEDAAPRQMSALARRVLNRVAKQAGFDPEDYNIFPHLGSLVVSAKPEFLRLLMQQPEVASAVANRQPGEGLIRPQRKRRVS